MGSSSINPSSLNDGYSIHLVFPSFLISSRNPTKFPPTHTASTCLTSLATLHDPGITLPEAPLRQLSDHRCLRVCHHRRHPQLCQLLPGEQAMGIQQDSGLPM